jgi:hypothetical protein
LSLRVLPKMAAKYVSGAVGVATAEPIPQAVKP